MNIQEICMIVFYKIKLTFQIPDSRPKSQYKVSLNFPFVTPVIPNAEADFTEIILWHRSSPVNLLHIFRTPFLKDTCDCFCLFDRICIKEHFPFSDHLFSTYACPKFFEKPIFLILDTHTYACISRNKKC